MMEPDKQAALDFMHEMRAVFGKYEFQVTVTNSVDSSEVVLRSQNYQEPNKSGIRQAGPRLVRDALRIATESAISKGNSK